MVITSQLAGLQVIHTIPRHSPKSGQKLFWQRPHSTHYGILHKLTWSACS